MIRKLVLILSSVIALLFVACASKTTDSGYYDRANKVSKEALEGLDKE